MSKHDTTLRDVFADPAKANIKWKAIESLLLHHGAEKSEGQGSRVRFALNGRFAIFHRPHPRPDTDKGVVKSVRLFLENAGVTP